MARQDQRGAKKGGWEVRPFLHSLDAQEKFASKALKVLGACAPKITEGGPNPKIPCQFPC